MKIATGIGRHLSPDFAVLGRRVSANTLWLFVGRAGAQGMMVLFTILIARRLGEVGLGQYAFMVSVVFLANVMTTFGTDMYLIRQIAAEKDLTSAPGILILQLGLSLPAIGFIFLLPPDRLNLSAEAALALRLYSLALIPMAFYSVFSAALRGVERMDVFTWLNLATVTVLVVTVWSAIQPHMGIVLLAFVLLGVQVFSALLAGLLCVRYVPGFRHAWKFSLQTLRTVTRASAPIALLSILGIVYQRGAIYLLMILAGPAATGWFSAALRAVEVPKFGHHAVMGALLPVMAQAHTRFERAEAYKSLFSLSFLTLLLFSGIAALLLFAFASTLTGLFYGSDFAPTIPAMRILAWTLIPFTVTNYFSLRLFAAGQEWRMLLPLSGGVLVLVLVGLFVIPQRGAAGSAGTVLVAESVQALAYLYLWRHSPAAALKER